MNYEDWWLSAPEVLEKLAPNDYKVQAYYLPDEGGRATDVYIFQGDRYIDKVEKVETYNRVYAEQTDEDAAKYIEQRKKVSRFAAYVKAHAAPTVGTAKKRSEERGENEIDTAEAAPVILPTNLQAESEDSESGVGYTAGIDWRQIALQDQ